MTTPGNVPAPAPGAAPPAPEGPPPSVDLTTLSGPAKWLLEHRTMDRRMSVADLFLALKQAEAVDKHAEHVSGNSGCWAFACFFLGMFATPFWVAFVTEGRMLPEEAIPLVPALFTLGFFFHLVRWWRYSKLDMPDDFRKVLLPFLDAIRNDVPRKEKIRIRLDIRGIDPHKEEKRPTTGWQGGYWSSRDHFAWFVDPWCTLVAPMADGSRLVVKLVNETLKHTRLRGRKNKRKIKWKKVACARVTLVPPGGVFDWNDAELDTGPGLRVKVGDREGVPVRSLAVKHKVVHKGNTHPGEGVPPDRLLAMLMELYGSLEPKQRAA